MSEAETPQPRLNSELRMEATAIKNGWDIPDEIKRAAINRATRIMLESPSERNRMNAMKVLLAANAQNLAAEKAAQDAAKLQASQPAASAVGPTTVEIQFDDDYYGTAAAAAAAEARLAIAETDAAADADPDEPGAGEDRRLRPAVG